jgi:hypothetical protein
MCQRIAKRWESKFARFVGTYGAKQLASELRIDPAAIYHWVRGVSRPKPEHAASIQRVAREQGMRLTLDDIYGHSLNLRAADPSIQIQIERRKVARA